MSSTDPMFDEEDLNEPSYYCRHGSFIGNPYGADYLCSYCEMGYTDEEFKEEREAARRNRLVERAKVEFFKELWPFLLRLSRADESRAEAWFKSEMANVKQSHGDVGLWVAAWSDEDLEAWAL